MKKFGRILLIDDDRASNYLTKMLLEDIGATVPLHVAVNGQEALTFLSKQPDTEGGPTLILLDVNMPVLNGFEFLERAVQLPYMQQSVHKIVMLSSSEYPADMERARQFNVLHYISKPITEEKLKELLE